ncbi:MAG: hypothetical protein JWM85_1818 [Acidimicrobiaceae bacterium]|nr:hypothetical protein [Acidimicrobiaceae bacterium]
MRSWVDETHGPFEMSSVRWLTNANVVDVATGELLEDHSVEIADGAVVALRPGLPPHASDVTDVGGRYVLPGLISCHTHLSIVFPMSDTDPAEHPAATVLRAVARAQSALAAGITTVRCVHEQHRADLWIRHARARGWLDLPRIYGAGRAITTPDGHGAGAACVEAVGEEGFYEAACEELRAGADHVKIFINGGLAREGEDPGRSEMSGGELAGTVRAANEHGTYVVAHSGASLAIRQALEQGVRCFEHAYELDAPTAELLAASGAYVTPTLVVTRCEPWMRDNGFEEATIANAKKAADGHLASIKRAIAAGVPLLAGTDLPPGDDVGGLSATAVELASLEQAGLSRAEALRAATVTPASLMGAGEYLGQVRPGFRADLAVLEENPLDDLGAFASVHLVLQDGRVVAGKGADR